MKYLLCGKALSALFLGFVTCQLARADIYISGHSDIGVGFENGNLHLHIHAEGDLGLYGGGIAPKGEYEPGDLDIAVEGPSISRPVGSQWDFLATTAGDPVWFLPQNSNPAKPFLGVGTEDLDDAGWTTPITWQFNSISPILGAPSQFALFQTDPFTGVPMPFFSSLLGGANTWNQLPGGHEHFNWAFTAEGIYDVEFTVTGTNNGSGSILAGTYTDTASFRFRVGSAVPEPSSFLLLVAATSGLVIRRRRF